MKIVFDSISITSISQNSGVFTGSNIQLNWHSQTKENSAMGKVIGDFNHLMNNINVVYDNDLIDMPIITQSNPMNQSNEKKGDGHH
ncbi:hypothetical protein [Cytobacillus praedii]|uniref:Uncharacterized protein n=1 Tax=Cytobacillus praedii TaxID=1742358 RepID=A0A4R1AZ03_9BACI|nr:hypothetical protein [Cytobacillus praedii]TCJ05216.1 hypothetical protein E0Y62_06030 [Cytobacillus praedii]